MQISVTADCVMLHMNQTGLHLTPGNEERCVYSWNFRVGLLQNSPPV